MYYGVFACICENNSSLGLNTKEFAIFEQSVTEINQKINSLRLNI
jgi:hypothetical protein